MQDGSARNRRKSRRAHGLATIILAGVLACPATASAQGAPIKQGAPTNAADGLNEAFADIIVTARRRAETLQNIPVAVSVVTPDMLRENAITDVVGLQNLAPSLTLFTFAEDITISLRGQGGFDPGASPAVVGYINEVPMPATNGGSNAGAFKGTSFYDLENIQILNGPQGTLFGRNTTGGAILFQTRRPTNDLEGYAEVSFGNLSSKELEFALNLPVVNDKFLVRVAGHRQMRDGYTRTLATPKHPDGLDLDNLDNWSGRVSVTLKPVEGFRNDTIAEVYHSDTNNASSLLQYVAPDGYAAFLYPGIDDYVARQLALGTRTQLPIGLDQFNKTSQLSITNITEIDLSGKITLRNIFGYYRIETSNVFDGDGTVLPVFDYPSGYPIPTLLKQFTEEVQLQGTALNDRLTWTAGAFLLHQPKPRPDKFDYVTFGGTIYGATSTAEGLAADNSKALYAQATYDLAGLVDGLKVTAGYRYTWDRRFTVNLPENAACLADGHDPICFATFKAPTWTLALDYQAAPDLLLYGTVRRGYRSGGINAGAFGDHPRTFPSEYVTDQEIGIKSRWSLGGLQGMTNLAVYHQGYNNIHYSTTYIAPDGSAPIITSSGASASIWGAELEAIVSPVKGLDLGGSVSWINLRYTHFAADLSPDDIADIEGRKREGRPEFKYNLHASYDLPISDRMGGLRFAANWTWQSHSGSINPPSVPADPLKIRPSYGLLNLSATWENVAGAPMDLSFFMANVTDNAVRYGQMTVSDSIGTSTVHYLEPRTYGVRMRFKFRD